MPHTCALLPSALTCVTYCRGSGLVEKVSCDGGGGAPQLRGTAWQAVTYRAGAAGNELKVHWLVPRIGVCPHRLHCLQGNQRIMPVHSHIACSVVIEATGRRTGSPDDTTAAACRTPPTGRSAHTTALHLFQLTSPAGRRTQRSRNFNEASRQPGTCQKLAQSPTRRIHT